MKKIIFSICLASLCVMLSCTEKKKQDVIIAQKPVVEQRNDTLQMQSYNSDVDREWLGNPYKISVKRYVDKSLPLAKDEQGQRYYDNKISLTITRGKDGSTFFDRVFTKGDFQSMLNNEFAENGALLGLVFDRVEGNNLIFAASVGSPDKTSDEYMPFVVTVSNFGNVGITKDTTLDTANPDEEEGV